MNRIFIFLLISKVLVLFPSCEKSACKNPSYLPHYNELLRNETYELRQELFRFRNTYNTAPFEAIDSIEKLCKKWLSYMNQGWDTNRYSGLKVDRLSYEGLDKLVAFSVIDSARLYNNICDRHLVPLSIMQFKHDCYKKILDHIKSTYLIHYWSGPESPFYCIPLLIDKDTFLQVSQSLRPLVLELYKKGDPTHTPLPKRIRNEYGFYLIDPRGLDTGSYVVTIDLEGLKGVERQNVGFTIPFWK